MRMLFWILILLSCGIYSTAQEANYSKWVVNAETGGGVGNIGYSFGIYNHQWLTLGAGVDYMVKPYFGIGSGIFFSDFKINDPVVVRDNKIDLTIYSLFNNNYLDIPLTVTFRPGFVQQKNKLNFIYNTGVLMVIPIEETGIKFNWNQYTPTSTATIDKINGPFDNRPRYYFLTKIGAQYGLSDKMGLTLSFTCTINPYLSVYSGENFILNEIIGGALALNLY